MKIRSATINDAKAFHEIHTAAIKKSCRNYYTKEQIKAWLKGRSPEGYAEGINKGEMYVAEENDKIIGFGHAIPGEILAIFVDPKFHKKGTGTLLLKYGIKLAKTQKTKLKLDATLNAQKFYEKNGFIKVKNSFCIRNGEKIPSVIMEYTK